MHRDDRDTIAQRALTGATRPGSGNKLRGDSTVYTLSRQRELDVLRVLLQEHRCRYRTQLRLLDEPQSRQRPGTIDRSTLAAATWRRLDDIEHALHALEGGRYGVCTGCVSDIPIDHLARHPAANRCPVCSSARPPAPVEHRLGG
ncbi:hypothetical protein AB0M46_19380 [Dactylosporangium sp. NPDC051485]|uniref:hypothetical protein n=1 Tax=Dactylosporangium sp. NPDC051485 TaxID=3154846 RepID=UPI003445E1AD